MSDAPRSGAYQHLNFKPLQPDHNVGVGDFSPADNPELTAIHLQVDGLEGNLLTPSESHIHDEQVTPTAQELHQAQSIVPKDQEASPVIQADAVKFVRPHSNESDGLQNAFQFQPANHKNPVMARLMITRQNPGVLDTKQRTYKVQAHQVEHHDDSQGQTRSLNRQPLSVPHHIAEAPPPSYQPTTLISSIEQDDDADKEGHLNAELQGYKAARPSESDHVDEHDGFHREPSRRSISNIEYGALQTSSTSVQIPDSHTDHGTDGGKEGETIHPNAKQQRDPTKQNNTDAIYDQEMVVKSAILPPETPAAPEIIQEQSPSTPAPRKLRSTSKLVVPMQGMPPRVTKSAPRLQRQTSRSANSPEQDELSDENLLEILISRHKQQKSQSDKQRASANDLKKRVRTLNHSVIELERENDEIQKELATAQETVEHVNADNKSLRGQLEGSTGRYRKLKDFARVMASEMNALKVQADQHKLDFSELKFGLKAEQDGARAAVSQAQALLKNHGKVISSVRQETNSVVQKLCEALKERDEKSSKLRDEVTKNRRLETHIVGLHNAQQQHNKAAKEGGQKMEGFLAQITQRFATLEAKVQAEPQVPAALPECLELLQDMSKKKQVTPIEFGRLKDIIAALDTAVTTSFEKLGQTLESLRIPDNRAVEKMLNEFKKTLDVTAEKDQKLRGAETEVTRLKQQVEGCQELVEEIRRAKAVSDSHAREFKDGAKTMFEWTRSEQQKSNTQQTGTHQELSQVRIKYATACSDLKKCEEQRKKLEKERTELTQSFKELKNSLIEEISKLRGFQEKASARQGEHDSLKSVENKLNVKIRELEKRIAELQISLKQSHEATEGVRKELTESQTARDQVSDQNEKLAKAKEQIEQQCKTLKADGNKIKQQLEHLEGAWQKLKVSEEQCASAKTEIAVLQQESLRVGELEKRAESLQKTLEGREEGLNNLKDKLQNAKKLASTLQDQLKSAGEERIRLEADLKVSEETAKKVQRLDAELKERNSELADLRSALDASREKELQSEEIAQKNTLLSQSLENSKVEISKMKEKLADQNQLQQLLRDREDSSTALQARFEDLKQQLEDQGQLTDTLRQRDQTVLKLQSEAKEFGKQLEDQEKLTSSLRQEEQTVLKLQAEARELKRQLKDQCELTNSIQEKEQIILKLQSEAKETERELQDQEKLTATLRQKEQMIVELQTKTNDFDTLSAALNEKKKACEEKDSNIRQLNCEIARQKGESQQLAAGVSELTPNISLELEKDVHFSQPLVQPQLQNPSGTATSRKELEPEEPRRRVADRSGKVKPLKKLTEHYAGASQPRSSGSTDLVPNSQLELADETLDFGDRGDSSSDDLPSDDAGSEYEDAGKRGVCLESGRMQSRIGTHPEANPERPSTAQTDLFNVHTTGLSGTTERQSSRRKNSNPDSLFDLDPVDEQLKTSLPKTVALRDIQLNPVATTRQSQVDLMSPRRLRDGTPLGVPSKLSSRRRSTPQLEHETNPGNTFEATPAPRRNKPQPNSAAKRPREIEPGPSEESGSDKRHKRNYRNLEVNKPGPKPTSSTPVRSTTSSGSRKGGSIIGTNAPAPGGKSSKPPRKPSKKDKFAERFQDTSSQRD